MEQLAVPQGIIGSCCRALQVRFLLIFHEFSIDFSFSQWDFRRFYFKNEKLQLGEAWMVVRVDERSDEDD